MTSGTESLTPFLRYKPNEEAQRLLERLASYNDLGAACDGLGDDELVRLADVVLINLSYGLAYNALGTSGPESRGLILIGVPNRNELMALRFFMQVMSSIWRVQGERAGLTSLKSN